MKTSKRLLLKQRLNNRLIPYFFKKVQQPKKMQSQYKNWGCILDPALALSHHGVIVAESMSKEIELWVVQELWNIVNNAEFYCDRIELITPQTVVMKKRAVTAEVIWSLKEWSQTKQEKDLAKLGMYWLGDNLQESLLPKDKPVEFFKQWQNSATALDSRSPETQQDRNILNLAFRDTIALAASLKSAFVLTQSSTNSNDSSPAICKALKKWGISSQFVNKRNPIVAMERQYIRQLIVRAGLGKLLIAGVNLAAFHLVIPPSIASVNTFSYPSLQTFKQSNFEDINRESYFWNNVKGVWYSL